MKKNIAIYVQHYLSPSMTFIYRQINLLKSNFNVFTYCSRKVENLDIFPENKLFIRKRNFYTIKNSSFFNRLFKYQRKLSVNPKLSFNQRKYFLSEFKRNNIVLIHAHFGPSAIEIFPIAKKMKIPLVITFHGYDISALLANKQYRQNLRQVLQYAKIIIVAKSMKKYLTELGSSESNIYVIRCGIPIEKFNFIQRKPLLEKYKKKEKIKLVQISNFVEKKGHKYTLIAFSKFLEFYENAELILAGNGYLLENCKLLARTLNIEEKVIFTGHLIGDDVNKLMKESDIFLHHSVTAKSGDKEGIPTVLMEAMATGLPVISTFHSGIPELIENGKNGFLIEERDIKNYVNKIKDIIFKGDSFGIHSREKVVDEFNLMKEVRKMDNIFNGLINS